RIKRPMASASATEVPPNLQTIISDARPARPRPVTRRSALPGLRPREWCCGPGSPAEGRARGRDALARRLPPCRGPDRDPASAGDGRLAGPPQSVAWERREAPLHRVANETPA